MRKLSLGVVGATGAVGEEILNLLENSPVERLVPIASARSLGQSVSFQGKSIPIQPLNAKSFEGLDLVFFSAGASRSLEFAPLAVKAGAWVVDNSSAFRMNSDIPLVIPEINPETIFERGIVAVPNCTTIILLMALYPIHRVAPLERLIVSTYQAVSGAGKKGLFELEDQIQKLQTNVPFAPPSTFPHPIAYNAIPQVDLFVGNDFTKEEMKVVYETQRILKAPDLAISATCVRIPVKRCHSESVYFRCTSDISLETLRSVLQKAPGVRLVDDPAHHKYPLATECAHQTHVEVGRLRKDLNEARAFHLWVVGDQLLKGASWNALQIAKLIYPEEIHLS
jgi:aspartate-semialdehyde dehydrogenase